MREKEIEAYLLIGGNLGNRFSNLIKAKKELDAQEVRIIRESGIYETEAWGKKNQPSFLNQCLKVKTRLEPLELLEVIRDIEKKLERVKHEKWGARTIDVDILYYSNSIISSNELSIPHPYIPERQFTLQPLAELAPNYVHPALKKTNLQLLKETSDPLSAQLLTFENN